MRRFIQSRDWIHGPASVAACVALNPLRSRLSRRQHTQPVRSEVLEQRLVLNALPLLNASADLQLRSINEDPGIPSGAVGTPVSQIISSTGSLQNFSDLDADPPGIAVVATNLQGGTLWASSDNGQRWQVIETVSDSEPLLLTAADARLYFQPAVHFSGSIPDLLTIRAWDGHSWNQLGQDLQGLALEDQAGNAVATSADGRTIAVTAHHASDNGSHSGQLRIFRWDGAAWQQVGQILRGDNQEEHFGTSVAMSADGSVIAVGAEGGSTNAINAGLVRSYQFDQGSGLWVQRGPDFNGTAANDFFGRAVALSADGNTLAIGADRNDDHDPDAGHVRIFFWDGAGWTQRGTTLDGSALPTDATDDYFGSAVALSADGTRLAVSAPGEDLNHQESGRVDVYDWNGSAWTLAGVSIVGNSPGDRAGSSLALSDSGDVLAIGSPYHDTNGNETGHVRVYCWKDSQWINRGETITADFTGQFFGTSIALSADGYTLVVGAERSSEFAYHAGRTRVYEWRDHTWQQLGQDLHGQNIEDQLGHAVAISDDGNTILVGTNRSDQPVEDAGLAQVFSWNPSVSSNTDTVRIDIAPLNDLPVLTVQAGRKLQNTTMVPGPPVGAVGTLFSDFISDTTPLQNYFDAEGAAPGIAITSTSLKGGTLWYSTNDGSTWQMVGNVSELSPLLLPAASGNRLYYQPADDCYGPVPELLTIRAWDGTYSWQQLGQDLNGDFTSDQSGHAVVLSPDGLTVLVAVPPNADYTHEQGQIRQYVWEGTQWSTRSIAAHGSDTEEAGWSVDQSADGTTIVVGIPIDEVDPSDSGRVRIRRHDGIRWSTLGSNITGQPGDELGWAVALSENGNTVAISSIGNSANGASSGRVQVWRWNGSEWQQRGQNIDGLQAFDRTGYSLDLSADGNTLAVGSSGGDNGPTEDSGRVDIYVWNSSSWVPQGAPIFGTAAGDAAGTSVSLTPDGSSIAIGAVGSDTNGIDAGNTRVFDWNSGTAAWQQRGQDLNGVAAGDLAGTSVSLAADGNTLIVGAPGNDGRGDESGQARIWTWNGSTWDSAISLNGEAPQDLSASSVAISANGTTVAVGAKFNDGNGVNSGHTRVYRLAPSLSRDSQKIKIDVGLKITYPHRDTPYQRPRITWLPVPEAVSYQVWIGNSSIGTNPWHQGTTTESSYDVSTDLGVGKMDLWVRGVKSDGTMLPWSDMNRFTVTSHPNVPDMTRRQNTARPTITWHPLPGAATYDVWVNNRTTGQAQYLRDQVSSNSWTPSQDMELGQYHIWVRGQAVDGFSGGWSLRQHFYVTPIPDVVTKFQSTFDRTPTLQWAEIPGATSYGVFLRNQLNGRIEANITGLSSPQWTPEQPLADGPYVWWGVAESSVANIRSSWTVRNDFYIGGRTQITSPLSPSASDKPLIQWQSVEEAVRYELWISTNGTTLIADQRQLTTAQYQIPEPLAKQNRYDVWVRAVSGDGEFSSWSRQYSFTVASADDPAVKPNFDAAANPASADLQCLVAVNLQQLTTAVRAASPHQSATQPAAMVAQSLPHHAAGSAWPQHGAAQLSALAHAVDFTVPHLLFHKLADNDWFSELAEQLELPGPSS